MSLEQWGILALVILLPLLEGVARLLRTRTNHPQNGGRPAGQVAEAASRRRSPLPNQQADDEGLHAVEQTAIPPLPSLPPPLPPAASAPVVSLARLAASHATSSSGGSSGSRSRETARRVQQPLRGDPVGRWLRPGRNLRRAIVLATILGPPPQS
jgi:hypothetical protein